MATGVVERDTEERWGVAVNVYGQDFLGMGNT